MLEEGKSAKSMIVPRKIIPRADETTHMAGKIIPMGKKIIPTTDEAIPIGGKIISMVDETIHMSEEINIYALNNLFSD